MRFIRRTRDVIEAEQYKGIGSLVVKTPSGEVKAEPGDYIVDRGNGDRYPVKRETFEKLYEPFTNQGQLKPKAPADPKTGNTPTESNDKK